MAEVMELEFEHIDWDDIVEAELSGDSDSLQKLRDRAAELKNSGGAPTHSHSPAKTSTLTSPSKGLAHLLATEGHPTACGKPAPPSHDNSKREGIGMLPPPDFSLAHDMEDYPALRNVTNIENVLPFQSFDSSPTTPSYAQAVTRNPKRTMLDRCTSPSDAPLKRSATSDIMKTPTEFKTLSRVFHNKNGETVVTSDNFPNCDATPESNSNPGKAELVQRRLFGTRTNESTKPHAPQERLTDRHRLAQRQKQIDFGKNTVGYERFIQTVPKWKRQKSDPTTPDKYSTCSSRAWQGQIRVWRRQLHKYDPPASETQQCFTAQDAALCDIDIGCK